MYYLGFRGRSRDLRVGAASRSDLRRVPRGLMMVLVAVGAKGRNGVVTSSCAIA